MRQRDELELLRRRINYLGYGVIAVFAILAAGFWQHQIAQATYYRELAQRNFIRDIPMVAPRGKIYDRENRLIADSRPSHNIVLVRENSPHSVEETVARLAAGIDMDPQELLSRINRKIREPKFRPILLKEDVAVGDYAYVLSHKYELPEINVEEQPRRRYGGGELAAAAIGYVGEITQSELTKPEFAGYQSGDQIGKSGLEKTYNAVLRGTDGSRRVIVNKWNREMEKLSQVDPIPGRDLYTTLDLDLQRAAEAAMRDRTGAAVALNPVTGEIFVLISKPGFDPNLFATRISSADYSALSTDPRKPLFNRAVQSAIPPGSVFKVFEAAAALEAESMGLAEEYYCPGSAQFYGTRFGCWKHEGHGKVGLNKAIIESCDVFFYNIGKTLGIDRIAEYSKLMGLGRKTMVDLPNETAGLVPSPEWKLSARKEKWQLGETISVAIGQGALQVTPIQAAWAMGGLVTGGNLVQPRLVQPAALRKVKVESPEPLKEKYPIQQSIVDLVSKSMWGVVNEVHGTGARARVVGFDVGGKTGTAQVVGNKSGAKGAQFQDNAWFVGFAPYNNPEIVVAVIMENAGHGGEEAAPVAHAIFDTYYRKKTGKFNPEADAAIAALRP